jgi:transcription elongation factor Elf1
MIQATAAKRTTLKPVEGRLRTRCAKCETEFYVGPSLSMKMGVNSGHCTCAKCQTFLHVEILEGDEAWTEPFDDYLARTRK